MIYYRNVLHKDKIDLKYAEFDNWIKLIYGFGSLDNNSALQQIVYILLFDLIESVFPTITSLLILYNCILYNPKTSE